MNAYYKEDAFCWLPQFRRGSLTMAVYIPEGQESDSCSGHKAGYPSSPAMVLKVWRIPGEPPCFSSCWEAEAASFWCQWQEKQQGRCTHQQQWKTGRWKGILEYFISGLPEGAALWESTATSLPPPQSSSSENIPIDPPRGLCRIWFLIQSSSQSRLTIRPGTSNLKCLRMFFCIKGERNSEPLF